MDALMRVFALLWQAVVGWVVSLALAFIAIPLMVLDVLWQLITGMEGFAPDGTAFGWVQRSIMWNAGQANYAITGSGEFKALP